MLKHRLIPVLFLKHGWLVRSELFHIHQNLGNAIAQVERYNAWDVDELIYIDITPDDQYETHRDDLGGYKGEMPATMLDIIDIVSKECFMPLTVGGKIKTVEDARVRFARGADKITINAMALSNPQFITDLANEFGSQAVVVSADALRHEDGRLEIVSNFGKEPTSRTPTDWCLEAQERGAGEIFLNAVHLDGSARGYDLELISDVVNAVSIPVIACGGAGTYGHFAKAIEEGGAQAAAAGNIFHFKEHSYPLAKKYLHKHDVNVR